MSEPTYTIQAVTAATGVPANTVNAWFHRKLLPGIGACAGERYARTYTAGDILVIAVLRDLTAGQYVDPRALAARVVQHVQLNTILADLKTGAPDHWFFHVYAPGGPDSGETVIGTTRDITKPLDCTVNPPTGMTVINVSEVARRVLAKLREAARA